MEEILTKVREIIRVAGTEVMKYYGADNITIIKKDQTVVTEIDFLSEKMILEGLAEFNFGILSEEKLGANNRMDKERAWIVDPIDGTLDFIKKTGQFSIMIGLVENGKVILGAVYQPTLDKLYYATKGGGAFLEEKGVIRKLEVSRNREFSNASMLGSRHHMKEFEVKLCNKLNILDFITHGSAGLKMCLVAEQVADIYINSSDKTAEWDICAGDIILSEAGGKISDMNGEEILYNKENYLNLDGFVVTNGFLHQEIIDAIEKMRETSNA